jgi:Na+-transporting NADH:ubiquinone oxidoreductase subunit NqrC
MKNRNNAPSRSEIISLVIIFSIISSVLAGAGFFVFDLYQSNQRFLAEKSKNIDNLRLKTEAAEKDFDKSLNKLSGWSPLGNGYEKMIKTEQVEKDLKAQNGFYESYAELNENEGVGSVSSYTKRDGTIGYRYSRYSRGRRW